MGIYAPSKSKKVNQSGEGSMKILAIPPIRKSAPMLISNFILWLAAMSAAAKAPANVPSACAKKGKIKMLGPE